MSAERGEGGGKEFERVLEALREQLADGTYGLHATLPAQRELAGEFGVSRDTVQRVLGELKSEGWVESRQGSGTRVIKLPIHAAVRPKAEPAPVRVSLGPFVARAFDRPDVRLDVFTLTSESLDAHIRLQAERIRTGEIAPAGITLRMLLPSEGLELPYPRPKEAVNAADAADRQEEAARLRARLQRRLRGITDRHTTSLRAALNDLRTEGLVPSVDVEVRHVPLVPTFKLYLRPEAEALHGPYEVVERTLLLDDGTEVEALDVLGLGSVLTRHVHDEGDAGSAGSLFVQSMQAWFDSCWELLADPVRPANVHRE
ncbi:GntR family transcriptional regulator [Streptomyces sp. NPDC127113]|uniref:GntR family transcriptional regulator n=1 Tax=Streptomyces sp. NPDC127113 TaxID=3345365 RepID=UPI00363FA5AC